MNFTSLSEYRERCKQKITEILKHPTAYFRNLTELESIMRGYDMAVRQFSSISGEQMFFSSFCDWLVTKKGMSGSSGWALAIDDESIIVNRCSIEMFAEFSHDWI